MLTNLKKLELSDTKLFIIENAFNRLTCLEELDLSFNILYLTPNTFKITLAPNTLNLTKLKVLNISFNPLNQINYSFFDQLVSLKTINYSSEQKKIFDYMLFDVDINFLLSDY